MTKVHLSVHKNTLHKRKKRELVDAMKTNVHKICQVNDIQGYAVVAWDSKCRPYFGWHSNKESAIQGNLIPSYVGDVLSRRIAVLDMKAEEEE